MKHIMGNINNKKPNMYIRKGIYMRIKCKLVYAFFFSILFLFVSISSMAAEVKSAKKIKEGWSEAYGAKKWSLKLDNNERYC